MDSANQGFLARQLLLTEVSGVTEEIPGGCLVWGNELWAGIWQPELIKDPEKFIKDTLELADDNNAYWRGLFLLVPPADETTEFIENFKEAMFLYDYPELSGPDGGAPRNVQILTNQSLNSSINGLEIKPVSGIEALIKQALSSDDQLSAEWFRNDVKWRNESMIYLAKFKGEPVGFSMVRDSDLASRITMLYVLEEHRNKGYGTAIVSHTISSAKALGKLLGCVYTFRAGRLRYFFSKLGFQEQLVSLTFKTE